MNQSITAAANTEKLYWLQVGRFLAAFWVLLHHGEGQIFQGAFGIGENIRTYGNLGVDFFFCLSGFIIIFKHIQHFGDPSLVGVFLKQRIIRIFPLVWVLMLLQIFASVVTRATETPTEWTKIVSDALLIPTAREHTINVAWTLRHEVFFYACTAVALVFKPRIALGLVILWLMITVAQGVAQQPLNLIESYLFSSWNLLFITGILTAVIFTKSKKTANSWIFLGSLLTVAGVVLFVYGGYPAAHNSEHLGKMLASSLGFAGVLAILIGLDLKQIKPPSCLVLLGDASYSIYLIHSTVLFHIRNHFEGVSQQIISIVAIPAILGISVLSFRIIERPSAKLLNKWLFGDPSLKTSNRA